MMGAAFAFTPRMRIVDVPTVADQNAVIIVAQNSTDDLLDIAATVGTFVQRDVYVFVNRRGRFSVGGFVSVFAPGFSRALFALLLWPPKGGGLALAFALELFNAPLKPLDALGRRGSRRMD